MPSSRRESGRARQRRSDWSQKTGDLAVGLSNGVTWSDIYDPGPGSSLAPPLLNAQGHVLFQAQTAPAQNGPFQAGDIGWGLWTDLPGHLSLVAHVGLPAPGSQATFQTTAGAINGAFTNEMAMNSTGQVAFEATLSTGQVGIWATDSSDCSRKLSPPAANYKLHLAIRVSSGH